MTYNLLPWHIFLCSGFNGIFPHCRPTITSNYSSHLLKAGMNILIIMIDKKVIGHVPKIMKTCFFLFYDLKFFPSCRVSSSGSSLQMKKVTMTIKENCSTIIWKIPVKSNKCFTGIFLSKDIFQNCNICMAWVFSIQ